MVLVVGATSFIGPAVVKKLLEKGFDVKCLIRTDSNKSKLKELTGKAALEFVTGNLQSSDSIYPALKGANSIVYLADLKNISFIKNMLFAVSKTNIRRAVFLSSTTVLVPQKSTARDFKLESEELIKKTGLDWTILRPTMIYGTNDDKNYSQMINFIKKRGFFVMFGNGENLIQPIYIDDVAEALSLVIENSKTFKNIYEICGKEPLKYKDMLCIVSKTMHKPFKIIKFPLSISKAAVLLYSKIFKNSSLKPDMIERMKIDKAYSYQMAANDFGFKPLSFPTGIEKLIHKLGL